jgi:uncharacterized membrane protein YedE/YeeE
MTRKARMSNSSDQSENPRSFFSSCMSQACLGGGLIASLNGVGQLVGALKEGRYFVALLMLLVIVVVGGMFILGGWAGLEKRSTEPVDDDLQDAGRAWRCPKCDWLAEAGECRCGYRLPTRKAFWTHPLVPWLAALLGGLLVGAGTGLLIGGKNADTYAPVVICLLFLAPACAFSLTRFWQGGCVMSLVYLVAVTFGGGLVASEVAPRAANVIPKKQEQKRQELSLNGLRLNLHEAQARRAVTGVTGPVTEATLLQISSVEFEIVSGQVVGAFVPRWVEFDFSNGQEALESFRLKYGEGDSRTVLYAPTERHRVLIVLERGKVKQVFGSDMMRGSQTLLEVGMTEQQMLAQAFVSGAQDDGMRFSAKDLHGQRPANWLNFKEAQLCIFSYDHDQISDLWLREEPHIGEAAPHPELASPTYSRRYIRFSQASTDQQSPIQERAEPR